MATSGNAPLSFIAAASARPSRTCCAAASSSRAMYRFGIERAETSIAFTSGMPPPSSVASVRAACDVANLRAIAPSAGSRRITRSSRSRCPGRCSHCQNATLMSTAPTRMARKYDPANVRDGDDDPRRERQLLAELLVEGAELRHHLQHDDRRRPRARAPAGSPDRRARTSSAASRSTPLSRRRRTGGSPVRGCRSSRRQGATPCRRRGTARRAPRTPPTTSCPRARARRRRRAPT